MNSNTHSESNRFFEAGASHHPTYHQIMEMVKAVEHELEIDLHTKRNRLHIQIANEAQEYRQEIYEKYNKLHEEERLARRENLERLKVDRELNCKNFSAAKRLQQHMQNSEEFRLELSKRLIKECEKSRNHQVQRLKLQQKKIEAEENAAIQESRRKQLEEMQKEAEAERILKQQKRCQAKLDQRNDFEKKIEKMKKKEAEKQIERIAQEQNDETVKRREEELKMVKRQEVQSQKEFLKRQIEQRKKIEEYHRQGEIQNGKTVAEHNRQQMEREATEAKYAKKKLNVENLNFVDYLNRARIDKIEIEAKKCNWGHVSLICEEIEADADVKRRERMKILNNEMKKDLHDKMKKTQTEQFKEKQREKISLEETQKQNAKYEQLMAIRKFQNRNQFQHDLQQQIEFKNMAMAYKMEEEAKLCQKMEGMDNASSTLTKKLINESAENPIGKHPFFKCLLNKN